MSEIREESRSVCVCVCRYEGKDPPHYLVFPAPATSYCYQHRLESLIQLDEK